MHPRLVFTDRQAERLHQRTCVFTLCVYDGRMKSTLVNFRADADELSRWKAALAKDGRTVSQVCRATLDRIAARVEKDQGKC